jgi:hypothetical protein
VLCSLLILLLSCKCFAGNSEAETSAHMITLDGPVVLDDDSEDGMQGEIEIDGGR